MEDSSQKVRSLDASYDEASGHLFGQASSKIPNYEGW